MIAALDIASRAAELAASRTPFVLARVVLAEPPTSAKPGDEAIVLGDGAVEGFVGGTCTEASVLEAARPLLSEGGTILLRITPDSSATALPGVRVVHNPCMSGGTLEIYLEARLPPPLVVVVGEAPIARALRELSGPLGWEARPYHKPLPYDASAVVVASHGRGEEAALLAALEANVPYIGLVASRRRGPSVLGGLDVSEEDKRRVRTPAGLDIGARTPAEVALAILAEIVASGATRRPGPTPPGGSPPSGMIDPVCGMKVVPGEDALHAEHGGREVWFCGRGCLEAFLATPGSYES